MWCMSVEGVDRLDWKINWVITRMNEVNEYGKIKWTILQRELVFKGRRGDVLFYVGNLRSVESQWEGW